MEAILEPLIASPQLPRYVEALQDLLAEEAKRRRQFYVEMDESKKSEFINGAVVMHSPAKWRHIAASENLLFLLNTYIKPRGLGHAAHEKLLVSLTRNDYEPDVIFYRRDKAAKFTPTQMQFPAPDFIAEVLSPSTARIDRGIKKHDYAEHGVGEYWIIDPEAQTVEQYALEGQEYRLTGAWNGIQIVASHAIEGFRIPVLALFDEGANVAASQGLREPRE